MGQSSTNSPLLGYNTNVRHAGHLFHIQTEDSGRDHPHVITHLFTEGTILSTKKTSYDEHLDKPNWEDLVRQLMKDQHKSMFVELREGMHDEIAVRILGRELNHEVDKKPRESSPESGPRRSIMRVQGSDSSDDVKVISPAAIDEAARAGAAATAARATIVSKGKSIFEAPESGGTFGDSLISDKSLDEVILSYLGDEFDD